MAGHTANGGRRPAELRRDPRCPASLRVRLRTSSSEVEASTRTVSRHGFDLRLPDPPHIGEEVAVAVRLPDGARAQGRAVCRSRGTRGLCGFALLLDEDNAATWSAWMDQEEATGGLWRLVGRWAQSRGDEKEALRSVLVNGPLGPLFKLLPRAVDEDPERAVALRFFMTGENGEAYRICFERHPFTAGDACDLADELPGFAELAERDVGRVLDQPLLLRLSESQPLVSVRVCELVRGGYAWIQGGDGMPTGLCGLATGELVLIELEGQRVFPSFSDGDLERIACDTFRFDMPRPVFRRIVAASLDPKALGDKNGKQVRPRPPEGVEAVAGAQQRAERVQTRRYGERAIRLYPEVWARVIDDEEHELLGPTMRDGDRVLVLSLVGHDSPRVVQLSRAHRVTLLAQVAR